ncbi:MAG TPA: FKBP-type peptidyl-prolyl cis-trans isomerase [Anaerolineae bacterium]|nr:FKBP-type peptidyl-prolyl cis-trans isomerase [Anaerolineae bacterium]
MVTDSGLKIAVLEEGEGDSPQLGETVSVHYRLWLEDGTQVDNSYDRGQPFPFVMGTNSMIPGWEEGVALMKVGEKAQLILPPELAYGEQGVGPIPPNATLIFEVELLDIQSNE